MYVCINVCIYVWGPVNLRPPTTVILQATSDNKRKVNARALAGVRLLALACARRRALSVFFAQRALSPQPLATSIV